MPRLCNTVTTAAPAPEGGAAMAAVHTETTAAGTDPLDSGLMHHAAVEQEKKTLNNAQQLSPAQCWSCGCLAAPAGGETLATPT